MSYFRLAQYEKAIKDHDKIIIFNPQKATAYYNRGIAKERLDQNKAAIKDFDKAIKLNQKFGWAYNNRGYSKLQLKQYKEARKDLLIAKDFAKKQKNKELSRWTEKNLQSIVFTEEQEELFKSIEKDLQKIK